MATLLPVGDPTDPKTVVGPLITSAHRERVEGYIRAGADEGAEVVTGGGRPSHLDRGFYVEPTLLAEVRGDMRVAREEIFGPVIVVETYDDDEEAIHLANDSDFGLYDYVFTGDSARGMRVAESPAGRQHRHQHDPAQPRDAVRGHEAQRGRPRRRVVRPPRLLELQSVVWPG